MSKKVKVLLVAVLLGGLVYINRAEIKSYIGKLPFMDKSANVSDEESGDDRGSYEYYYHNNKDDSNTEGRNTWRMNSKD